MSWIKIAMSDDTVPYPGLRNRDCQNAVSANSCIAFAYLPLIPDTVK